MDCSSNYVFEVHFPKKQAIARIGFRPSFAPKALNWGKAMQSQPVHSTCRTVHLRFKPQLRYLFWTYFQVSNLAALTKSPNTGVLQGQGSSFSEWTVILLITRIPWSGNTNFVLLNLRNIPKDCVQEKKVLFLEHLSCCLCRFCTSTVVELTLALLRT